jgi:hypothetical protein
VSGFDGSSAMPKYTLIQTVSLEKLASVIPVQFHPYLDFSKLTESEYSVAIFPTDRKKVVHSGQAQALLDESDVVGSLVVVGDVFTIEAAALLRQRTPYFFCREDSFWSDASYHEVNLFVSSNHPV